MSHILTPLNIIVNWEVQVQSKCVLSKTGHNLVGLNELLSAECHHGENETQMVTEPEFY